MKAASDEVKSLENILADQAHFLEPIAASLSARWAQLYLNAFGRSAFFSSQRVERIFRELTEIFVDCLKSRDLDAYLEELRERGKIFAKLGVPFEELIISIHLFEETCLEHFFESYPHPEKLPSCVLGFEDLHNQGLAALAASYFDTAKEELGKQSTSLLQENEALRKELEETRNSIFSITQKELSSMQLLIGGINQKLRNRVYEMGRVHKILDALEGESDLPKLLRIASQQILATCPNNSCAYFGLFDEERKKVELYHHETREALSSELVDSFYFSELPKSFQDALYDESKKSVHFNNQEEIPKAILNRLALRNQSDFFVMPIRRYREISGFLLLSTSGKDFFCKTNYHFYQRVGQAVSRSVSSAILYMKSKRHDRFTVLMSEMAKPSFDKPIETTLDFCLGSLIDLLGAERSSFMRFDETKKELRVFAAKGHKVYPISGTAIKWGEGIAGLALKESRPILLSKIQPKKEAHLLKRLKSHQEEPSQIKSLLCVPIFDAQKPLGVVNISTINFHKDFGKTDIEMASRVARRIAGIVSQLPEES